jgi:hypothetical protein
MSGGSFDYAYSKLDRVIEEMAQSCKRPLHKAFIKHLVKVSKALYELEWEVSGDTGTGDADLAIKELIKPQDELRHIKEEMLILIQEAKKILGAK